jgi:putative ABC transport system permease protein
VFPELQGLGDPVGRWIRIGEHAFRVCGVLGGPAAGGAAAVAGASESLCVFLPYRTALKVFGMLQIRSRTGSWEAGRVEVDRLVLSCADRGAVVPAAEVADHVLKRLHARRDWEMLVPLRRLEEAEATQRVFRIVMVLIAGISLVVGGIGIANIMFASVMERTREIGIRRALGARKADVLTQFLLETVLIALGGGLFGCLLGVGGSLLIGRLTGWPVALQAAPFALALLISCAVGIASGVAPARRAARLDPVAALWHE